MSEIFILPGEWPPIVGNDDVRYFTYDFLLAFHNSRVHISYRFKDSKLLVENC